MEFHINIFLQCLHLTIQFCFKIKKKFNEILNLKIYSPILNIAIDKGDIKIVKLLLESGKIDVNYSIISSYLLIML